MSNSFVYNNKRYDLPEGFDNIRLDSKKFCQAIAECYDGSYEIVTIAGAGGCGKSVIYQIICKKFGQRCLATASTGVAAFNIAQHGINCSTLHSALRLPAVDMLDWNKADPSLVTLLEKYDYLLIDEISMVNCNILDYILIHVRLANEQRFGRKKLKVILFGDVLQLPPVSAILDKKNTNDEDRKLRKFWKERYGEAEVGYWFFSPVFRETRRITIELDAVYRQSDDKFKSALDVIRKADMAGLEKALENINGRVVDEEEHRALYEKNGTPMLYLTGRNRDVRAYNMRHLEPLRKSGVEAHEYVSSINGPMTSDRYYMSYDPCDENGRKLIFKHFFPILEDRQTLYLGSQVMCLCNDRTRGFQNGTLGKIIDFRYDSEEDAILPVVKPFDNRNAFTVPYHDFEYFATYIKPSGEIVHDKIFIVRSLACKSAYAVTFHKAQGLTLDAVYIDTRHGGSDSDSNVGESYIPYSGIYLGLSRCKTLEGVGLSDRITPDQVKVNEYAPLFFLPDRDRVVPEGDDDFLYKRMIVAKTVIRKRKKKTRLSDLLDSDV